MMQETEDILQMDLEFLPLKTNSCTGPMAIMH